MANGLILVSSGACHKYHHTCTSRALGALGSSRDSWEVQVCVILVASAGETTINTAHSWLLLGFGVGGCTACHTCMMP